MRPAGNPKPPQRPSVFFEGLKPKSADEILSPCPASIHNGVNRRYQPSCARGTPGLRSNSCSRFGNTSASAVAHCAPQMAAVLQCYTPGSSTTGPGRIFAERSSRSTSSPKAGDSMGITPTRRLLGSDCKSSGRLASTGRLSFVEKDQLDRGKLTNRYLRTLWDQWWRDRDRLAKCILPQGGCTFHGLRPANRPERRLAWLRTGFPAPTSSRGSMTGSATHPSAPPRRRDCSGTSPSRTNLGRHTGPSGRVNWPRRSHCLARAGYTTSP